MQYLSVAIYYRINSESLERQVHELRTQLIAERKARDEAQMKRDALQEEIESFQSAASKYMRESMDWLNVELFICLRISGFISSSFILHCTQ